MEGYLEPPEYYQDATKADWIHIDDLQDSFDKMKESVSNILNVLYGEGDAEDIEIDIKELCNELGLKFPCKALKIEKKEKAYNNMVQVINALRNVIEKE